MRQTINICESELVCCNIEQIAAFFTYFFIGFFGAALDLFDNAYGLPRT